MQPALTGGSWPPSPLNHLLRVEAQSGKRVKGAERARLITAQIAWQSGNLAGLYDAVRWCGQHRQPLPDSVCVAILALLKECLAVMSEGTGQHARWAARYEQDQQDLACWESLRRARAGGLKGDKALEAAAAELAGVGIHLEPGGIQKGSDRVKQARRTAIRPGRYYSAAP